MDEHGPGGPVSKIRKRILGGSLHVNRNTQIVFIQKKLRQIESAVAFFVCLFVKNMFAVMII